jgi:uncharacterized protein (TIGR02265 family)
MPEQRLVFEQSIEGMYLRGHPDKLTPAVKAELKKHGIDLDQKLKPFYPSEQVNEATRVFRRLAYRHLSEDAVAYAQMGERIVDGYFNTLHGKALVSVLKLFALKRIVHRLPQAMASGSNFLKVTVDFKGPAEALLTLSDTEPSPHLNLGVVRRAFTHWFGAPGFQISLHEHVKPQATFRLTWAAGP